MFIRNFKKGLTTLAVSISLIIFSQTGSAQQLQFKHNKTLQKPHHQQTINPRFSTPTKSDSKAVAHCWTVAECSQMISDCLSVGGHWKTGTEDPNTNAPNAGSCTL